MPDYRKKTHKHSNNKRTHSDIKMKRKNESGVKSEEGGNLRVVKGNKRRKQAVTRGLVIAALTIVATVVLLNFLLPTGIGDFVKNRSYSLNGGEFPTELVGSDSLFSSKQGSLFYTLTDTNLDVSSVGGKKVLSSAHGFSAPVMRTSPTRAIVYEQGGKAFKLFGVDKLILASEVDGNVISANVSRNGSYAVATTSKEYASKVTVYSKSSKMLFEWNSSVEIVSDVAISPNGQKLAVSVFTGENGQYVSKIYIFDYDSVTPIFTEEYKGKLIYSLDTQMNTGFVALFDGGMDFISWNKFVKKEFSTDYTIRMYRSTPGLSVLASSRSNDKKDTKFNAFTTSGNMSFEVEWKESITDFAILGDKLLILSDTSVYLVDKNGTVLKKGDAGFGGVAVYAVSSDKAVVVTDNSLISVTLNAIK